MRLFYFIFLLLFSVRVFAIEAKVYGLSNANVTLFKIDKRGFHKIWQGVSSGGENLKTIGAFEIKQNLIKKDNFYLISIKGGESFDVNIDGKIDKNATPNKGTIHALFKGSDIIEIKKFYITFASELLYEKARIKFKYHFNPKELEAFLNQQAKTILQKDINNDKKIDNKDILRFLPTRDSVNLRKIYKINLAKITKIALQKREILLNISPIIQTIDIKKFKFPKKEKVYKDKSTQQIFNLLFQKIVNKFGKDSEEFKFWPKKLYYGDTRLLGEISPDEGNNIFYYALFDISNSSNIKLLDTTPKVGVADGFVFNGEVFYKNYILVDRGIFGTFLYKVHKNSIEKEFVFNLSNDRALADEFKKGFLNDNLIYLENPKHTKIDIIDITNPLNLFAVGEFKKCARVSDFEIIGDKIYLTCYNSGFYALKFNKNRLKLLGKYEETKIDDFAINSNQTKALLYSMDKESSFLIDLKRFKLIKENESQDLAKHFKWAKIKNMGKESLFGNLYQCDILSVKNGFEYLFCPSYGLVIFDKEDL